ncbi:MAG: bifunctional (p)ppGpp synthetase/guanosine-3',5'-bis(diphosphate) 3'-pyrophosphohydrolase [Peptococcaceae bacterium]|jgi:GTP pyrophosphokinase|nr:bifunctional (p)ppGpp synthetase/guanosine-3',5'-bis(diphosphate) 3'-pyrophosphohydrolase [Peptococcaceae bacterium]
MSWAELREKLHKLSSQGRLAVVEKAYTFAEEAHRGQRRNSGEEYIEHPMMVALILAELELDEAAIAAALLHDVVEDTKHSLEDIEKEFGAEVALLVDGVTKLGRIPYQTKMEQQVENLRKMFLAMAKDIRVIMIKLADRLHNMRTLKYHSPEKQREIAQETLEIFAPLANRLGIYRIKWELEDLAFCYLKPREYHDLADAIAIKRREREALINEVISQLRQRLDKAGIKADIAGRSKHFYSIYEKMTAQNKELNEIYDLTAVRVVVASVNDCYGVLGIIHTLWKPIPGRFKDYIAMPKPNMYQSLHTTLAGAYGEPFEVQIRTWEMHRTAEFGIAAHWKYKEGGKNGDFEQRLNWLRQLLEFQHDAARDADEFMDTLKIDLFADMVFIFTPKGDVVELPAQSSPVDFAYRVHTDVGHRCVGAKVNGRIVPLNSTMNTGDIIEIITSKHSRGPSRDWLSFVKTSQAKNRIRQWFKKEQREENIVRGREILEREVAKLGFDPSETLKSAWLQDWVEAANYLGMEDMLAAIGDKALSVNKVLTPLRDELTKEEREKAQKAVLEQGEIKSTRTYKSSQGVRVKGVDNVLIRFAHCCNPLPGDPIVGYITRGRGVSVHRQDCKNIQTSAGDAQNRMIEVAWDEEQTESTYAVDIQIFGNDRTQLVTDIMTAIMETRTVISGINARVGKDKVVNIQIRIDIRNLGHLQGVLQKIRRVKDVTSVERLQSGGG